VQSNLAISDLGRSNVFLVEETGDCCTGNLVDRPCHVDSPPRHSQVAVGFGQRDELILT